MIHGVLGFWGFGVLDLMDFWISYILIVNLEQFVSRAH